MQTPDCVLIRPAHTYDGKQGFSYFEGISAQSAGSVGLCMHLLVIPPGVRAKAHLHEHHETTLYGISGTSCAWVGQRLEKFVVIRPGEFFYIPAGMPHWPANLSKSEPCTIVLARSDPNEQESVVLLPDLEANVDWSKVAFE